MAGPKPAAKGPAKGGPKKAAKKGKNNKATCYDLSNGLKRKNRNCPKCGPGVFMANHPDRRTCGKCGYMEKN